jgi:putative membrane protein
MGMPERCWIREPGLPPGHTGEMVAMMFWYGAHWAFWQTGLMWAGMLVFWGLLIWGIYVLITTAVRRQPDAGHGDGARQILDQRLARGEIDPEEYQRLRDLMSAGPGSAPERAGTNS